MMTHSPQVASFQAAQAERAARDAELHAREVADYRALMGEKPVSSGGAVWWCFVRAAEPFEVEGASHDIAVVVAAVARGLSLTVERHLVRHKAGAPLPVDRVALSEMLRSGVCDVVAAAPAAKATPPIGLRLRIEIEETDERSRIFAGSSEVKP